MGLGLLSLLNCNDGVPIRHRISNLVPQLSLFAVPWDQKRIVRLVCCGLAGAIVVVVVVVEATAIVGMPTSWRGLIRRWCGRGRVSWNNLRLALPTASTAFVFATVVASFNHAFSFTDDTLRYSIQPIQTEPNEMHLNCFTNSVTYLVGRGGLIIFCILAL